MESRARQFYEQIVTSDDTAGFLKHLVEARKPETEFLEFKGAGQISESQIKEYWSKTLSGFANTEGGVLIWGIRAARIDAGNGGHRKIDAASELDLAKAPAILAQLLKDVLLESLIEPLRGVEIKEVPFGRDGQGFVACLIPEGENKPYRAQLESAKQYYQRIGDNFAVIPHSLLRSLFYPRSEPELRLTMSLHSKDDMPGQAARSRMAKYNFLAFITNRGSRSAREVLVSITSNYSGEFGGCNQFGCLSRTPTQWEFVGARTLHQQQRDVQCFSGYVVAPSLLNLAKELTPENDVPNKLVFNFTVYCDDASPSHQTIEYDSRRVNDELTGE